MLSLKKDTVLVFRRANGGRRDFFEDNNRLGPTLALSNRKSSQQQDAAGRLSLETDEDGEESIKRCWTFIHTSYPVLKPFQLAVKLEAASIISWVDF